MRRIDSVALKYNRVAPLPLLIIECIAVVKKFAYRSLCCCNGIFTCIWFNVEKKKNYVQKNVVKKHKIAIIVTAINRAYFECSFPTYLAF